MTGPGSWTKRPREWHDRAWQGVMAELKKHLTQSQS